MVYSPENYRDKFSGVVLNALYAGCPIVGIADTWIGETVRRFQVGVVLTHRSPENIYEALQLIRREYIHVSLKTQNKLVKLSFTSIILLIP